MEALDGPLDELDDLDEPAAGAGLTVAVIRGRRTTVKALPRP
jgi:hypothetical protein